ncbi:MAG: hypothetical protein K2J65_09150 [Duncaniella sp.]|nr:hypothetical protein [Duncaniella sp.]
MKKILFLLISLIAAISAFAFGSGTKAIGNILFKNGQRLEAVNFEMPCELDKQIKIFPNGKQQKVETDSIDFIILWNEKNPDNKQLFKPFLIENVDLKKGEITGIGNKLIWLCCQHMGDNASLWVEIGRPAFKKGNLVFKFNKMYTYVNMNYILKKTNEYPAHIPNKYGHVKKFISFYFKDDPELVNRVEAGEYDTSDWGYKSVDLDRIISDYNPAE